MSNMVITDTGAPVATPDEKPRENPHAMDVMSLIPANTDGLTDEQVLALGQKIDIHIVSTAMKGVTPNSPRSIEVAISAVNSMKGTAQANIKQRENTAMAGQIAGAAGFIANVLGQIPNRDQLAIGDQTAIPAAPNIDNVPEPILVPGETRQGTENLNPDDFLPR